MRAGAPETRPVAFPVLLLVCRSQLGDQQAGVLKDASRQQPRIGGRPLRRRTTARTSAGSRTQIRTAAATGAGRPGVPRRPRSRTGRVRRRCDRASTRLQAFPIRRHDRLVLPDSSDGAQRRVRMVRIEIENRLEQHERHAIESDGVVPEPAPGQPGILPAAETVFLGADRIGVVEISLNGPLAFRNLRRPVGDRLPIDPGHDLRARVVLQRTHEPSVGCAGRGRVFPTFICGSAGGIRTPREQPPGRRTRVWDSWGSTCHHLGVGRGQPAGARFSPLDSRSRSSGAPSDRRCARVRGRRCVCRTGNDVPGQGGSRKSRRNAFMDTCHGYRSKRRESVSLLRARRPAKPRSSRALAPRISRVFKTAQTLDCSGPLRSSGFRHVPSRS